jgi:hypothetical protein
MTQKLTTAKAKTTATKAKTAKTPNPPKERKTVLRPKQSIVDARTTKAPTLAEVQDHEWMNWVEYAQSRIKYLENKLVTALETIDAQKANIDRLNRRVLQG